KTFVATAAVLMRLTGAWANDEEIVQALRRLPERLATAASLDWARGVEVLSSATNLATIGRGPTLGIAREAALKLKEICNLQTEAFSGAEFLHGPIALVSPGYPVLMFMPADETAAGMRRLADDLTKKGAALLIASTETRACLPVVPADRPET